LKGKFQVSIVGGGNVTQGHTADRLFLVILVGSGENGLQVQIRQGQLRRVAVEFERLLALGESDVQDRPVFR